MEVGCVPGLVRRRVKWEELMGGEIKGGRRDWINTHVQCVVTNIVQLKLSQINRTIFKDQNKIVFYCCTLAMDMQGNMYLTVH